MKTIKQSVILAVSILFCGFTFSQVNPGAKATKQTATSAKPKAKTAVSGEVKSETAVKASKQ